MLPPIRPRPIIPSCMLMDSLPASRTATVHDPLDLKTTQ